MYYRDDADGVTVRDGQVWLSTTFPVFTPIVTTEHGWEYIAAPQRDPRAACMLLAAAIWKQDPGVCLAGSRPRSTVRLVNWRKARRQ